MVDLDEEFVHNLAIIDEAKADFSEDEQNIIDAWVSKLSEPKDEDEERTIRNQYAQLLVKCTRDDKLLQPPFDRMPPDGDLTPLRGGSRKGGSGQKHSFQISKMPCSRPKSGGSARGSGAIPKNKKPSRMPKMSPSSEPVVNEFEDPEEMAKVIARSKGQTLAEFVTTISRHTSDFGVELRSAMKAETASFREYVDHVLSQRIKDLTEVLNQEQNAELKRIRKDTEKWHMEFSHCKKRIKEIIPDFDLEAFRSERNYLRKFFTIESSPGLPQDDSVKRWKEESCHRLKWYSEMIYRISVCNDQTTKEIAEVKSKTLDLETREAIKQQNHVQYVNCEIAHYQKLKLERDQIHKENAELLSQLEEMCD